MLNTLAIDAAQKNHGDTNHPAVRAHVCHGTLFCHDSKANQHMSLLSCCCSWQKVIIDRTQHSWLQLCCFAAQTVDRARSLQLLQYCGAAQRL
jgi:hypothetical protein